MMMSYHCYIIFLFLLHFLIPSLLLSFMSTILFPSIRGVFVSLPSEWSFIEPVEIDLRNGERKGKPTILKVLRPFKRYIPSEWLTIQKGLKNSKELIMFNIFNKKTRYLLDTGFNPFDYILRSYILSFSLFIQFLYYCL